MHIKNIKFALLGVILISSITIGCSSDRDKVKWEYKVIQITYKNHKAIEPFLNQYGKIGWELVQVLNNRYIYKRILTAKKRK